MWKIWRLKNRVREILTEKKGVGVVEVILILVEIYTHYYGVCMKCMA